jgi:hypothetical protein
MAGVEDFFAHGDRQGMCRPFEVSGHPPGHRLVWLVDGGLEDGLDDATLTIVDARWLGTSGAAARRCRSLELDLRS